LHRLYDVLAQFGIWDLLDIAIVSTLIYSVLVWFKRTKAVFVAVGMFMLAGVYLLARGMNLVLTAYIFQGFFAVFLIALVVIFQEELRHFFERIAVWSLLGGKGPSPLESYEVATLIRAVGDLSKEKIGAIIVVKGRDPIERHVSGGIDLDGRLSEALLKSIFDPHSDGHDGAVVIDGNRVERFATHLPLSKEFQRTGRLGTRHTAALGLSELSDAVCLVVSEERGTISVAQNGEIAEVHDLEALQSRLDRFMRELKPQPYDGPFPKFFRSNWREKLAAVALSFGFWVLFAQGSKTTHREFDVPIAAENLPSGLSIGTINPDRVRATLAGQRRDFYLLDPTKLRATVDVSEGAEGPHGYLLTERDFRLPEDVTLLRLEPPTVTIELVRQQQSPQASPARRSGVSE
jgi:uncharacterized protein (TIGR00159 family)